MSVPANPKREYLKPPVTNVGVLGWLKQNLFSSWLNSLLTIVTIGILLWLIPPLIKWAFIDSLWNSTAEACRDIDGACWSVIPNNIKFIFLGFYPEGQEWRPLLMMVLLIGMVIYSKERKRWKKSLLWVWLVNIIVMAVLMHGGFGLPVVETSQWSGLPLTLILSFFGMIVAYPFGVLLALGRRSRMPAIKTLCVIYIEMIRGVPLISLLFMSSVHVPAVSAGGRHHRQGPACPGRHHPLYRRLYRRGSCVAACRRSPKGSMKRPTLLG